MALVLLISIIDFDREAILFFHHEEKLGVNRQCSEICGVIMQNQSEVGHIQFSVSY